MGFGHLEEKLMRKLIVGALLAATLGTGIATIAAPAPASAQGIVITPNGIRVYPGDRDYNRWDRRYRRNVDRSDAITIARRNGVGQVRRVTHNRGDWVVVGDARRGRGFLRVRIDDRSGRVIQVSRVVRF
jgi:hypothetical protein